MKIQRDRYILAILLTTSLAACGGGGGSSPAPVASAPAAPAPAPVASVPDVVKIGPITGFGSVFVNGQRFETSSDDTNVLKDDSLSDESELEIGMIVRVRSSSQNAAGEWIADDIEFDEDVKGPVDSVGATSLVVLGQTVNVTADTFIDDGLTLADFSPGDVAEVSGFRTAGDEIEASFLERKAAGNLDEYEVLGQIRDLDTNTQQFRIGDLIVNYGSAELDDLDGGLANGLLVEAEDANRAYMAGDLTLSATKVEGENRTEFKDEDDDDRDDDQDEFEIEAVITEVIDDATFMLGDIEVTHNSGTEFSGGTADDLSIGVRVEVEGDLTASGVVADEIEFDSNEARIAGLVNEIDVDNSEIIVMGISVQTAGAELEDSLNDVQPFTLADLSVGDFVELEGNEAQNVIRASEIKRDDTDDDSELRGLLDSFDATARTVTILGELVVTNGQTQYEVDELRVGADEFFARLHAGQSVVDADWDGVVGDTLSPARELSLED